jgi:hypothetical protein
MRTRRGWIALTLVAGLAIACSDQSTPSGPDAASVDAPNPAFKTGGSQANIGVNVLLSTKITDAILAELDEFGRLRGLLPEIRNQCRLSAHKVGEPRGDTSASVCGRRESRCRAKVGAARPNRCHRLLGWLGHVESRCRQRDPQR